VIALVAVARILTILVTAAQHAALLRISQRVIRLAVDVRRKYIVK
jgi:hypothetical protein